jgi:hypothetical protein
LLQPLALADVAWLISRRSGPEKSDYANRHHTTADRNGAKTKGMPKLISAQQIGSGHQNSNDSARKKEVSRVTTKGCTVNRYFEPQNPRHNLKTVSRRKLPS